MGLVLTLLTCLVTVSNITHTAYTGGHSYINPIHLLWKELIPFQGM